MRGRYSLAWQKVLCYEYGGLDHKRSDYKEKTKNIEKIEKKKLEKKSEKDEKKIEGKKKGKMAKKEKKKREKREIGIET